MISNNYVSMSQLPSMLATRTTSEKGASAESAAPAGPPPGPPPGGPPPAEYASIDAESLFEALLETYDADGDASLSSDELTGTPVGDFLLSQLDTIDADGDGLITLSEFKSTAESQAESRGPEPVRGMEGGPPKLFDALLANDDADGDGAISAGELAASPVGEMLSAQFSQIDTDGDGLISETEMTAAESASRSGGAEGMRGMGPPPPGGPKDAATSTTVSTDLYESLFNAINTQAGENEVVISSDLAYRLLEQIGISA